MGTKLGFAEQFAEQLDFAVPPVVEVALSAQFEPLKSLGTPQIGLLWQEFRDRFPRTEEHAPLEPVFERFGAVSVAGIRIEATDIPPARRVWFLNGPGTELIQIQQDRFVHNWRKITGEPEYPRYARIRETFETELSTFEKFLEREGIGRFEPNQCEITYVNHILSGKGWETHADLD